MMLLVGLIGGRDDDVLARFMAGRPDPPPPPGACLSSALSLAISSYVRHCLRAGALEMSCDLSQMTPAAVRQPGLLEPLACREPLCGDPMLLGDPKEPYAP